jgi:large conductance mechanosensitive channel
LPAPPASRTARVITLEGAARMSIISEFREFALKGNVVDLAIGVIIGAAFNGIVQSLVNDLVMPPIGYVTGGMDFADLEWVLRSAYTNDSGEAVAATTIGYGRFINAVISFLIVAWVLFLVIKGMNRMKRKEEAKPPAVADTPEDVKLLGEIRDLLKARR